MNYQHEALEERDESIKNALSNIDQDTIAKTKEILNSKEYKKLFRKTKTKKWNKFKNYIRKHCLELISILVAIVFGILALIFK